MSLPIVVVPIRSAIPMKPNRATRRGHRRGVRARADDAGGGRRGQFGGRESLPRGVMPRPIARVVESHEAFDRVSDTSTSAVGRTDFRSCRRRKCACRRGMPWRNADELIAVVPPRMNATMKQIAVNAVMAGARIPAVVVALQAVSEPEYGRSHRQTTAPAGAPLIIVNGPVIERCASTAPRRSGRAGAATIGGRCGSCS